MFQIHDSPLPNHGEALDERCEAQSLERRGRRLEPRKTKGGRPNGFGCAHSKTAEGSRQETSMRLVVGGGWGIFKGSWAEIGSISHQLSGLGGRNQRILMIDDI